MRIAIDLPECGGIDKVDVALHQFGESGFGMGRGVALEQFGVVCHFQVIAPAKLKIAQKSDLTWRRRCVSVSMN
jgi:hypothetical protein